MLISGIQPSTLLDYPEKTACIVFTPGCNFRCGYCHNPEFVLPENIIKLKNDFIPEQSFFNFLSRRKGLLDGVVISGGEPTTAADLIPFMKKIKAAGFLVKLDTNGNRPDIIKHALEKKVVDYIAMDLKTSLTHYQTLVGKLAQPDAIKQSIDLIKNSGIDYEFRSTLLKEVHSAILLDEMSEQIQGARRWYLQTFRPGHTLDTAYQNYHCFSEQELLQLTNKYKYTATLVAYR